MLGLIPFGERLHYELQKRAGGLRTSTASSNAKIEDWRLMAGHLRAAGVAVAGTRFLEMGTGWYPTFPFCLFLGGAKSVITVDLNRTSRRDLTVAHDGRARALPAA